KLDGDFVAFENDETLVSEATIAVFEQLGAGTSACPSETVSPELLNDANVVVESSMPVENSSLTFVPGTPATGKCAVTKRAEELLASLEIPKKEIPLTERYPHLAEAARADKEWRNCQRTTSTLINRKPFVEPSFVSFSDDVNGTEAHLSFSNASINSIGIQKQGNGFTHVFSSYVSDNVDLMR
uniref:Uncharacterized protein n=1 Tax=Panagrolaimus sp. JU765 TaxID=591449 RepID=A0AC34QCZ9_9BILA